MKVFLRIFQEGKKATRHVNLPLAQKIPPKTGKISRKEKTGDVSKEEKSEVKIVY